MTRRQFHAAAAAALLGAVGVGTARVGASPAAGGAASTGAAGAAGTKRTIARTAVAAGAFMRTLSAEQRKQLLYAY